MHIVSDIPAQARVVGLVATQLPPGYKYSHLRALNTLIITKDAKPTETLKQHPPTNNDSFSKTVVLSSSPQQSPTQPNESHHSPLNEFQGGSLSCANSLSQQNKNKVKDSGAHDGGEGGRGAKRSYAEMSSPTNNDSSRNAVLRPSPQQFRAQPTPTPLELARKGVDRSPLN